MKTFIKSQMASLVSTATDFSVTIFLIEIFSCPIVAAGAAGNISGAVVNFFIGRNWVFDQSDKKISVQAVKYAGVWCGYLMLTTLGMIFMQNFTSLHYVVSKAVISVIISFTYYYYTQKKLVFN